MPLVAENTRIQVEPYQQHYEAQVLELARAMRAESASHADMPMDEAKLLEQLRCAQSLPDEVYFRIAVRDGEVLGGFFGVITSVFFSRERAAKDMAWFVKKSRRGSQAALRLVADFEQWAMDRGVRKFFLGQTTGVAIETTRKLYEHLGYRVVGVNTVKALP